MRFFSVNFILQKFCLCKKNDKYQVWISDGMILLLPRSLSIWRTSHYILSKTMYTCFYHLFSSLLIVLFDQLRCLIMIMISSLLWWWLLLLLILILLLLSSSSWEAIWDGRKRGRLGGGREEWQGDLFVLAGPDYFHCILSP